MFKDLFKNLLERTLIPAIDGLTKGWKTPFEVDDLLWNLLKTKARDTVSNLGFDVADNNGMLVLNLTAAPEKSVWDYLPTFTAVDAKQLFVRFVTEFLFKEIDAFCKKWTTPLEMDDYAWTYLKGKILDLLDTLDVIEVQDATGAKVLALTGGACHAPNSHAC